MNVCLSHVKVYSAGFLTFGRLYSAIVSCAYILSRSIEIFTRQSLIIPVLAHISALNTSTNRWAFCLSMRKLEDRANLAHKAFAIPPWISREIFPKKHLKQDKI